MTTKKAYMYVLECADKTLYTGYTTDLQKRLATHNAGTVSYTHLRLASASTSVAKPLGK